MKFTHIVALMGSLFFIFVGYLYAFRVEEVTKWSKKENDKSIIAGSFLGKAENSFFESPPYNLSFRLAGYAALTVGTVLLLALVTGFLDR